MIPRCGCKQVDITDTMRAGLDPRFAGLKSVAISGLMPVIVALMILFSLMVQMAEGLSYGVVPYVSRPALGVVSGMVGAGGNMGSLVTVSAFFASDAIRTDQGLIYMAVCIMIATSLLFFVYFPEHGSGK